MSILPYIKAWLGNWEGSKGLKRRQKSQRDPLIPANSGKEYSTQRRGCMHIQRLRILTEFKNYRAYSIVHSH